MFEPDDPIEPKDVAVEVCNDCNKGWDAWDSQGTCECDDPSGSTEEWWLQCQVCRRYYRSEADWQAHKCTGYHDEDGDYY